MNLGDSEKDWQLSSQFSGGFVTESAILREYSSTTLAWWIQLPIRLRDSKNLREALP
jgi:hypothetical protein